MIYEFKVNSAPILFWSVSVFLFVEVCDLLLPFSSVYAGQKSYVIYYGFFLVYFLFLGLSAFWKCSIRCALPEINTVKRVSLLFLLVALFSLFLVLYDRIFIQGVNYSDGVALARESWRAGASGRRGASSVYNVVGNLLFPLVYFSFVLSYIFYERHKVFGLYIVFSSILILSFSVITGGRELLLVLVAVIISSSILRNFQGLSLVPKGLGFKFFLVILVMFLFAIYIAYSRSQSYTEGLAWYASSLASRLGGSQAESSMLGQFTPEIVMPVLIYVAHVKWVFLNLIENSVFGGLSTFRQAFLMLDEYTPITKGLVYFDPPSYTPNWISLIGSIYYDAGVIGFIVFCFFSFFAVFVLSLVFKVRQFNRSMFSVFFSVFFLSILVMAPFAFIFEIVQFIYFLLPLFYSLLLSILFGIGGRSERRFS
jgi:hypothetical protein